MSSKIIVTLFSLFAELEPDLVSLRTKETLAAKKAQGVKLGKLRGTIQASKFDKDRERIEELLALGDTSVHSDKGGKNYEPGLSR
jgi:putative DNA-invertase from lambdoid prophage Rac